MVMHAGVELMNPGEVSYERSTGYQNVGADRIGAEIEEAVFGLRRPLGGEQVFDTAADGPPGSRLMEESDAVHARAGNRGRSGQAQRRHVARLGLQRVPRAHPGGATL